MPGNMTICAATDPTAAYAALGAALTGLGASPYVSLFFTSAWNSATSFEYKVEWSRDGLVWFPAQNVATLAGTNTLTEGVNTRAVTAAAKWCDTFKVQAPYMRLVAKRTGGTAADTLAVDAVDLAA